MWSDKKKIGRKKKLLKAIVDAVGTDKWTMTSVSVTCFFSNSKKKEKKKKKFYIGTLSFHTLHAHSVR